MVKQKRLYENTTILPEKTVAEINLMLNQNGITDKQWTDYAGESSLAFIWKTTVNGQLRELRFKFVVPDIRVKRKVWNPKTYKTETMDVRNDAVAYRLLFNYLRNKLEAVKTGMVTLEQEFMAQVVTYLPNGQESTMGERLQKAIANNTVQSMFALEEKKAAAPNTIKMVNGYE